VIKGDFRDQLVSLGKKGRTQKNITGILAWAAENEITFEMALVSLLPNRFEGIQILKSKYQKNLEAAIEELTNGFSLSAVLKKHLNFWLPTHYCTAVEVAESQGCLKEALIQLGENNQKYINRRQRFFSICFYPILLSMAFIVVTWFLMVFIFPKLFHIHEHIGGDAEYPPLFNIIYYISGFVSDGIFTILVGIVVFVNVFLAALYSRKVNWLLLRTPFIKRPLLRYEKIEAVATMAIFLKLKISIPQALDMIIGNLEKCAVRKSFLQLRTDLQNGHHFDSAWRNAFPKDKLGQFYVSNGITSNRLQQNLLSMATYLQDKDRHATKVFITVFEPCVIIIIAFFVSLIVGSVFEVLNIFVMSSGEV
jgi:type II secretory pathway component PulF